MQFLISYEGIIYMYFFYINKLEMQNFCKPESLIRKSN